MSSPDFVLVGGGGNSRSLLAMLPAELRPRMYVDTAANLPSLVLYGDDDAFLADPRYADVELYMGFVAPADCSMERRRRIIGKYRHRKFATVISDAATVMPDCVIGQGSLIFPAAVVNTGAFLGDMTVVNTGAIIEHDVTVGENTFIGPGAVICGEASVGSDTYIGAGVCVRNGCRIGDGITVGIGSVVIRDVTEPGVYAGNPLRKIRNRPKDENLRNS